MLGASDNPHVKLTTTFGATTQMTALTAKHLVRMSSQELDGIYQRSAMAPIPPGKARGRALVWPGSRIAGPASGVAGLIWQGKVFRADGCSAVTRSSASG